MTGHVYVLMYHRVCEARDDTACWFARGTAVTPARFEAQVAWLRARTRLVTLTAALDGLNGSDDDPRPYCVITFDDGYRDALLAPRLGVPVTVFPVAGHTGDDRELLWFDRYYDILHRARRRDAVALDALPLPDETVAPPLDEDLRWWVRGPLKERLQSMSPDVRTATLDRLADALDADGSTGADELYLTRAELRSLARTGHGIGGHGATHTRLTGLDADDLTRELRASRALLGAVASASRPTFCYPDGAYDARVVAAVRREGFHAACTVAPGVFERGADGLAIPRILMRDVSPDDARWPSELRMLSSGLRELVAT